MSARPGKYFSWSEFDVDHRRPLPPTRRPAYRHLCRHYLDPLREEFGPVTVTSSLRSPGYNARVGGAPRSQHLTTAPEVIAAADVWCRRGLPAQWFKFLDDLRVGGLGLYQDHVHVDTRLQRARW